jgi:probable rRNA maturation factor
MLETTLCESFTFKNKTYSLEFFVHDSCWLDFLTENNLFLQQIAFKAFGTPLLTLDDNRMNHINVIFCNDDYIHTLNRDSRGVDKPTNVLSFPTYDQQELKAHDYCFGDMQIFGDIFIAHRYCLNEAEQNSKPLHYHIAHMVTHGILHIMGYDHSDDKDAEIMEALEIDILGHFKIPNPY